MISDSQELKREKKMNARNKDLESAKNVKISRSRGGILAKRVKLADGRIGTVVVETARNIVVIVRGVEVKTTAANVSVLPG